MIVAEVMPGQPIRQAAGVPPAEVLRNGYISVLGFGSLLSERSSKYTTPNLKNFRLARVRGWRRVFAHCAPIFFERGIANFETREMSSLSVERCENASFIATLFEIPVSDFAALEQREAEFDLYPVFPENLDETPIEDAAILCARSTDEKYRQVHCKEYPNECSTEISDSACLCVACTLNRFGVDRIWRDDVLPCRVYLRHCVIAAQGLGDEVHSDFLDNTFLADRETTIRTHLEQNPTIISELPPVSLQERYCG
mmetsp:Transcript_34825/g.48290  ORF Transcript_34825/g.48290 Transcript_34825/m.48290 type:complete len:255 (-) Transcript_34825:108-872(-)